MSDGRYSIYVGDGAYMNTRDGELTIAKGSTLLPSDTVKTGPVPTSLTGPGGERVASIGPWGPAAGELYKLAQTMPLDPLAAQKLPKFIQGMRAGRYGNAMNLSLYNYGFNIFTATESTPRYRLSKMSNAGSNESGLMGYGFYDDLQNGESNAWKKRGMFLSVPLEREWVASAGTDGSLCVWEPETDTLTELWQFKWRGRTPGKLDGIPTAVHGGRLENVSKTLAPFFPKYNGSWFHGLSASRLAGSLYCVKVAELDRAIDENGYLRDTITVTDPDGSTRTMDALDSIEHILTGAIGTPFSARGALSYPAQYCDNYDSTAPDGNNGVRYGQISRMPASIDFRTWTPTGWGAKDQRPLNIMRLLGRAWQKHGFMLVDMGGSFGIGCESGNAVLRNQLVARIPNRHLLPYGSIEDITYLPVEQLELCAVRTGP